MTFLLINIALATFIFVGFVTNLWTGVTRNDWIGKFGMFAAGFAAAGLIFLTK